MPEVEHEGYLIFVMRDIQNPYFAGRDFEGPRLKPDKALICNGLLPLLWCEKKELEPRTTQRTRMGDSERK